ncbi:MAG: hypothetical protein LUH50_01300 [Bacteroides intestinalis]|nr:hypothetical protein [Bacteroides intestinalis]
MKRTYLFFMLLIILSSCQKTVIGKIEEQQIIPWRSGGILKYKISYYRKGKIDSTYLTGNRIYKKGTIEPFYFEPGDSIQIKIGLFGTSFVRIHSLVERKR